MNIGGLYPRSNKTKVAYLSDLATESQAPFIAMTESHLTADVLSAEVQITDYKLYRSDRLGGRTHGGCAVYCRKDITVIERFKYSNNCCECQVLELKELELLLVNVYRPPNAPKDLFEEILQKCQDVIDKIMESEIEKCKTVCAVGDYNFPFIQCIAMAKQKKIRQGGGAHYHEQREDACQDYA